MLVAPLPAVHGAVEPRIVRVYVDGVLNAETSVVLNIPRPTGAAGVLAIGASLTATGSVDVPVWDVFIGQIRVHDGMLTPEEVAYNYAIDAELYQGEQAGASGVPPVRAPATPVAPGPVCPRAWPSPPTHELRAISLQLADSWQTTNAFVRHACQYWYATANFGADAAPVAAGDATHILRVGLTGEPGTVSIQSANYPDFFLTFYGGAWNDLVYARPPGGSLASLNASTRALFTWELRREPAWSNDDADSFFLFSRAQGFEGYPVAQISSWNGGSTRVCTPPGSVTNTNNLRLIRPATASAVRLLIREPLLPLTAATSAITSSRANDVLRLQAAAPTTCCSSHWLRRVRASWWRRVAAPLAA